MCLQIANQGEKYEDHREIPFQVFRWVKWSIDMGFQVNHGNGSTHGEVSIPASGTAVHKHVRKHICFSQENTWFKVHKYELFQNIVCKLWNPCQHFRAFLSTCFGIFDKNNNFMNKNVVSIRTASRIAHISRIFGAALCYR